MKELLMKVLVEAKQMKEHNLSCYSASWSYVSPKAGYEKEFEQAKREYMDVIRLIEFYATSDVIDVPANAVVPSTFHICP